MGLVLLRGDIIIDGHDEVKLISASALSFTAIFASILILMVEDCNPSVVYRLQKVPTSKAAASHSGINMPSTHVFLKESNDFLYCSSCIAKSW